jgi:hypothetical protein
MIKRLFLKWIFNENERYVIKTALYAEVNESNHHAHINAHQFHSEALANQKKYVQKLLRLADYF